jgi:tetratricopeptide (TPR) repeat protein
MKSLPWVVTALAVVAAVVGTNKLSTPAVATVPETPARLIASAAVDVEKQRPFDALRKLQRIPTSDRLSPRARQLEGTALLALHFESQAVARWKLAIDQDPSADDAPFRLFDTYFLSGRHAEARRLAVELAPKQSPSYAAAMLLEVVRQEHERPAAPVCLEHFEPVLIREPENPVALRTVGRSFVELGRVTEGLLLLKTATEKNPEDEENWIVRMESLSDAGRMTQAAGLFKTAPASVQKHPRVLRILAGALEAGGDEKTAEERLRESLAADPNDRKTHTQLASLLTRRGKAAEAKKHADRAMQLDAARERQAELLNQARGQGNNPGPELLRRLGSECRDFGWTDVAEQFDKLAKRRSSSMGTFGR